MRQGVVWWGQENQEVSLRKQVENNVWSVLSIILMFLLSPPPDLHHTCDYSRRRDWDERGKRTPHRPKYHLENVSQIKEMNIHTGLITLYLLFSLFDLHVPSWEGAVSGRRGHRSQIGWMSWEEEGSGKESGWLHTAHTSSEQNPYKEISMCLIFPSQ